MFSSVELVHIDSDTYALRGISAQVFLSDVARIYRTEIDPKDAVKDKLFFNVAVNGVLFKQASITFNKYFSLDVYLVLERLYDITQRSVYKDALDALLAEPNVGKYFTKPLPLPTDAQARLDSLPIKLFDFQRHFIESYYNAKHKLGLDGFILSFLAGGGKTFTAIAAAFIFDLDPVIITAPKSTLDGWKSSILRLYGTSIKESEVKVISDYNPSTDKVKWRFLICNYERLDQAREYATHAVKPPRAIFVDEAHNFRNLNANRVKALLHLKRSLDIHNIIAISATPIKSLSVELIPMLQLIDPSFNEKAQEIFRRLYSKMNYDNITGLIIKNKLSIYMERYTDNSSLNLPPLEQYNVNVKLRDPTPYLIETVKDNIYRYVQNNIEGARAQVKPNLERIKRILQEKVFTETVERESIEKYLRIIQLKISNPLDQEAVKEMVWVKQFEQESLKPLSPELTREIIDLRKKAVYYVAILLGKAMGIYYIQGKINLLVDMVRENVDEFVKIIRAGEMKTIIFATFAQPLEPIRRILELAGIGCVLHVGGMDVEQTRDEFKNDNTKQVLLATAQSVGTGTDGYQFIANQIIFLNTSYRYVEVEQNLARVHRKGQTAKSVKAFFLHLDTGDKNNILERESEILMWSRNIVRVAIDY